MTASKHVLGISGGKDSAALAIYMAQNHPEIDMEYFFTDTGEELPEVYDYLIRLEGYLGKKINRLNPDKDFQYYLKLYNYFLPSAQQRWCTSKLKIHPFEEWIRSDLNEGVSVTSYVAIRFDEPNRMGHQKVHENYNVRFPFQEERIDRSGVMEILDSCGIGVPEYYSWRSRSGCTFCFFQRKVEWVRLLERYPEEFEKAKKIEQISMENDSPFTWTKNETLEELSQPDRVNKIKEDHEKRRNRELARRKINPLDPSTFLDDDELFGQDKFCITCHK